MCGVEVEERLSGSLEMTQAGAGRKAARTSPAGDWAPLAGRAGGSWSALPSHPTTPVSPEAPTLELRELAGTDSPTQHSPPQSTDVRGTQEQQQQQPEEGGRGRQHLEHSAAGWCGRGRGCGASRCARGRGLQGERGGGGCGGREAMAPAAAGGPIAGEEGAAEAESGRGSQRLCLPPSSLGRRNQSRGRGWEGSGARAGAGGRGAVGWQLRQSSGGTLGREPCALGLQARSSAEGGCEVPGRGPRAPVAAGPACLAPFLPLSRTGSPPPPPRVGGKEGRGSRVERSGGVERSWGMGDGLEGRRLTGLLTVKRENFPGMRELGGGGVRREMLERGPGEEVLLGRWVLRGGVPNSILGPADPGGVTPYLPRLRAARPFLSRSSRKGGSPRPPLSLPSHPASSSPRSGEGCEGGD